MSRVRYSVDGLRVALDLPAHVRIVGVSVSGEFVDLDLDGADLDPPPPFTTARTVFDQTPPPDEMVAEYDVRLGHRLFARFRAADGPAEHPLGTLTDEQAQGIAALYPAGPGPREVTVATPEMVAAMADLYPPGPEPRSPELVAPEETLPPSGEGSRGGRTRKAKE